MGLNADRVAAGLEKVFLQDFRLRQEDEGEFSLLANELEFHFHSLPRSAAAETRLLENRTVRAGIHIWEDQWKFRRPAVLSRMAALLGHCDRIHGRKTQVQRIDAGSGYRFLEAHHLLVPLKGKYRFGLCYKQELASLAVFSGGRKMEDGGRGYRSFELLRFCHAAGQVVTGGLSKLLAAFAATFQPNDIMTYVDLDWSAGAAFLKNGFVTRGTTPPQVFWIRPEEGVRYYPQRLPAPLEAASPAQLHQLGYYRICNGGSLKLIRYYE